EGKINAEEAARLLEAVNESETKKKRGFFIHGVESFSDMMSDMMGSIMSASFKNHTETERVKASGKKKLQFKGISGDLELNGIDTEEFVIRKDGIAKILEEDDTLLVKTISGDVTIDVPKKIDLEVKGISGNLILNNIDGNIEVKSVSGDINGKGLSGTFEGEFVSGDVELEYERVDGIKIKARSGDVVLKIDESVEAEIEIASVRGRVRCELPLKKVSEKGNYLRGILNTPKSKIEIKNNHGSVILEKRQKK
ncbi:MAG: DUF4097 family beta strand repeat-containing protein, partial [candidate division WOR-3 bacterium]